MTHNRTNESILEEWDQTPFQTGDTTTQTTILGRTTRADKLQL